MSDPIDTVGLKEDPRFQKMCPFKQNEEIFDIIFSRINWLEQEIRRLESTTKRDEI